MSLVIEHDRGVSIIPADSLLVFIDETGNEKLSDPNAPFFGFGGCLCKSQNYFSLIDEPWISVQSLFSPEQRPLHAADLNPKDLSHDQMANITKFFKEYAFGRFAAVIKADAEIEAYGSIFHVLARCTLDKVIEVVQATGEEFTQVVMCFEHSQRLDALYADYFRRYPPLAEDDSPIPVFYATQEKNRREDYFAGLSVADFIAHTAGSMSRSTMGGKRPVKRRDFDAVFQHPLARHLFIDAIRT